jgi:hypothetical protein
MSNQTLRDRFRLSESSAATVSLIIKATKEAGLIKMDESESTQYGSLKLSMVLLNHRLGG